MLIVCPECATSYQVEAPSLGQSGRSVRCARCKNIWYAAKPLVVPALAAADEFDIVDAKPKIISFFPPPPEKETVIAGPPIAEAPAAVQDGSDESIGVILDAAAPEAASTEGIDLESLKQELAGRAEEAATVDAMLSAGPAQELTMTAAPPLAPAAEPAESAASQTAPAPAGENGKTLALRRARSRTLRRRQQQWPLAPLPTAILALVMVNAALVTWRMDIVRLLPQTASFYSAVGLPVNLRGLAFQDIKMSREEQEGMPVLVVEGFIANVTRRALEVPRLRLAVRNDGKNEIYSWTTQPSRSVLGPGETLSFRARLASPPAETRDVMVRFFTRRDIVAGIN